MVRPLSARLIAWCLLLIGAVSAASPSYLEALQECMTAAAKAVCDNNFETEIRSPNACLCQGSNILSLETARCLARKTNLPIVEAENFLKDACEFLKYSEDSEDEPSTSGSGKTTSSLLKADGRTSQEVKRNAKDEKKINKMSKGAIAGVAGGGGIAFAGLIGVCVFCIYRRRSMQRTVQRETLPVSESVQNPNTIDLGDQKAELPSDDKISPSYSQPDSANSPIELSSTTMQTRFEMEGDNNYQSPVELPASTRLR